MGSAAVPAGHAVLIAAAALLCGGALSARQAAGAGAGAQPAPEAKQGEPRPEAPPRASGGAPPSDDAFKMGSPAALPPGVTQEEMWPAATAEQWRQPCLVHWQRTFDDALRVARAEHRPILVAVNMDGEIASEHFAGVRYREPATGALMSRYACVIASVYRHTPRDYDEAGQRIECPRFGTVTCGEHIEAERELYAKYFDGKRISPRHIVLDLSGKKTYDVYFSWDTATVFTTFTKGVEGWPLPDDRIEPTSAELALSADVQDREALEREYAQGDREVRRAILTSLVEDRAVDQVEVLRSAIFGFDLELAGLARRALAKCETEGALELLAEALKAPLEPSERQLLLDAVGRMSQTSPRARTLAALHSGLSLGSRLIEPEAAADLARQYGADSDRGAELDARAAEAEARPQEPGALLALAESLLARAEESGERRYAQLLIADARSSAEEAGRLGASGPRLEALLALTSDELGRPEDALQHALAAVEGGLLSGGDARDAAAAGLTPRSQACVLELFAEARRRAIRDAYRAGDAWPPEWLSDVNAAYARLAGDPSIGPEELVDYYDFLRWIGATPRANTVLDDALRRFPDAPLLHDRLRGRLLWEGGPQGLERGYADLLARGEAAGAAAQLQWFAGYAELVAAEHYRRRGELEEAVAAYGRAVESYRANAERFPEGRDTCLHFIAMADAGRARVALERRDLPGATQAMLDCLTERAGSAASQDGLGITPLDTAKMIAARLKEAGDTGRAASLQAALDALDPKLLEPPPSEPANLGRGERRR
jgi:hypothetical protein